MAENICLALAIVNARYRRAKRAKVNGESTDCRVGRRRERSRTAELSCCQRNVWEGGVGGACRCCGERSTTTAAAVDQLSTAVCSVLFGVSAGKYLLVKNIQVKLSPPPELKPV